jgi:histidinol phosphatase-like PHP family hydrolase
MKYILDTHVHTKEVSPCSDVYAEDMVDLYVKSGYNGVIITDHYYRGYFERILGDMPWDQKIRAYLKGYVTAKSYAANKGMDVFLSMEITFNESNRDYLIYGITEDLLLENPRLYALSASEFKKIAKTNSLFIVQAHPFRPDLDHPDPDFIDAVEVFNGNRRHFSNNTQALKFAAKHGLPGTSGSDFHKTEDLATGGMILPYRIKELKELIGLLQDKNSSPELIRL